MLNEVAHRKQKRELEITLIIDSLYPVISLLTSENRKLKILEFGSGKGHQIPYLKKLGQVTASDLFISHEIKEIDGITFRECSITNTPFQANEFDLIFSNHVIEHLEEPGAAFNELQRIGQRDCIYAFSVPTNIWLLLSLFAQYYSKVREGVRFLSKKGFHKASPHVTPVKHTDSPVRVEGKNNKESGKFQWLKHLLPKGHGVKNNFAECYHFFRLSQWKRLFSDSGFKVINVVPLLLYGPSEFPVIPTIRPISGLNMASSVLFLMKKKV